MTWTTISGWVLDHRLVQLSLLYDIQVKNFLDELDTESKTVTLEEFKDLMVALEEAGWRKQKPKKVVNMIQTFNKTGFSLKICKDYVLQFPRGFLGFWGDKIYLLFQSQN